MLYRLHGGKPLFPFLRELKLAFWPISVTEASLLFSSALEIINIEVQLLDESVPSSLNGEQTKLSWLQQAHLCVGSLIKRSPGIRELTYYDLNGESARIGFLIPIFRLKDLTTFWLNSSARSLRGFKGGWLQKLSGMANLRSLRLTNLSIIDKDVSGFALDQSHYLEHLTIVGHLPLLTVLARLVGPSIRHIGIETFIDLERGGIFTLLRTLASNTGHHLTSFYLQCLDPSCASEGFINRYPSTHFMIQPLLKLRTLRRLELRYFPCNVTNEDISFMAEAWPDLQRIQIMPPRPIPKHMQNIAVGFSGISALASRCPRLRFVMLPLDLGDPPALEQCPRPTHEDFGRGIYLFMRPLVRTPTDKPRQIEVATLLLHLFPHIDTTVSGGRRDDKDWREILNVVDALRKQVDPA